MATSPGDLLFSYTGGVFGTFAGPAYRWIRALFSNDAERALADSRALGLETTSNADLARKTCPGVFTAFVQEEHEVSGAGVKGADAVPEFEIHPTVKDMCDLVPLDVKGDGHGWCGEIFRFSGMHGMTLILIVGAMGSSLIEKDAGDAEQGGIVNPCRSCGGCSRILSRRSR